jgi:hypothetical protein
VCTSKLFSKIVSSSMNRIRSNTMYKLKLLYQPFRNWLFISRHFTPIISSPWRLRIRLKSWYRHFNPIISGHWRLRIRLKSWYRHFNPIISGRWRLKIRLKSWYRHFNPIISGHWRLRIRLISQLALPDHRYINRYYFIHVKG